MCGKKPRNQTNPTDLLNNAVHAIEQREAAALEREKALLKRAETAEAQLELAK